MDKFLFIYTTQFHENVRRNGMIVRQKSLNHLTSLASDKAEKKIENEKGRWKEKETVFFNICENLNNRLSNILGSI